MPPTLEDAFEVGLENAEVREPKHIEETKRLEMVCEYPSSMGIAVPTDAPMLSVDISQLCRVLSVMGTSLSHLQEETSKPPAWLGSVTAKIERIEVLDRGFTTLTEVVSNLLALAQVAGEPRAKKAQMDLDDVSRRVAESKDRETTAGGANRDPFHVMELTEMKHRICRLEKRVAVAPSRDDVVELKDYVTDRTKKLKSTVVTLQSQLERKLNERSMEHLEGFGKWQGELMEVMTGKLQLMTERLNETHGELEEFREFTRAELREAEAANRAVKEWAAREFSTCSSQVLNMQMMIQKVIERVGSLEHTAAKQQAEFEAFVGRIDARLVGIDSNFADHATRFNKVGTRIDDLREKLDHEAQQSSKLADQLIEATTRLDEHAGELATVGEKTDRQLGMIKRNETRISEIGSEVQEEIKVEDEHHESLLTKQRDLEAWVERTRTDALVLREEFGKMAKTGKHYPDKFDALENALEEVRDLADRELEMTQAFESRVKELESRQTDVALIRNEVSNMIGIETRNLTEKIAKQETRFNVLQDDVVARENKEESMKNVVASVEDLNKRLEEAESVTAEHARTVSAALDDVKSTTSTLAETQAKIEEAVFQTATSSKTGSTTTSRSGTDVSGNGSSKGTKTASGNPSQFNQMRRSSFGSFMGVDTTGQGRRASVARTSAADQQQFAQDEANTIAQACFRYEKLCVEKDYLCQFPDDVVMAISAASMEMATFISEKVDAWTLSVSVTAADNKSSDVPDIDEREVEAKRQAEKTTWLRLAHDEVAGLVSSAGLKPNPLQLQARERVFARIVKALEMCFAKNDSFMVLQSSGLASGGKNVPTCIACDRPLPKRTQAKSRDESNTPTRAEPVRGAPRAFGRKSTHKLSDHGVHDPSSSHSQRKVQHKDRQAQLSGHDAVESKNHSDDWYGEWN